MRQSPSEDRVTHREGERDSSRGRGPKLSARVSDGLVLGTRDPSVVSDLELPGGIQSPGDLPGGQSFFPSSFQGSI